MIPTRTLGRTGFEISEIGFGAWAVGGKHYGTVDDPQETIRTYLDSGGNFIDTARAYAESEQWVGEVIRGRRDAVYVASKTKATTAPEVTADLESSLRQLQTDYIDLYYLHIPPETTAEIEAALDALDAHKHSGKIRAIGASIKGPDVTDDTIALCRTYIATGRVDALQVIYSLFRQRMQAVFDEAAAAGVGIVARTVLESGFLTGKYPPGHVFAASDHRSRWGEARLARIFERVADVEQIAGASGYPSTAALAIAFALGHPQVSTAIIGAKTPEQTQANIQPRAMSVALHTRLQQQFGNATAMFNTGD